MNEVSLRLEIAAARAAAGILAAHVHLSHAAAARLSDRIFPLRTIELYCDAHELAAADAEWIRIHALARAGLHAPTRDQAAHERRMRAGILRFQDWMRLHLAPHRDPVLRERLQLELAHSRACILKLHARGAVRFAEAAAPDISAPVAVSMYLDRLDVDVGMHAAVHALALDRIGGKRQRALQPPAPRVHRLPRRDTRTERQEKQFATA